MDNRSKSNFGTLTSSICTGGDYFQCPVAQEGVKLQFTDQNCPTHTMQACICIFVIEKARFANRLLQLCCFMRTLFRVLYHRVTISLSSFLPIH